MQSLIIMYSAFLGHIFLVTGSQKLIRQSNTVKCLLLLLLYISAVKVLFESGWIKELSVFHLSTGIAASLFFPMSYLFVQSLYKRPLLYSRKWVHLFPLLIYLTLWIIYYDRQELYPYASRFFYNVFDYGIAIFYSVPLLKEFHSRVDLNVVHNENNTVTSEDINLKNIDLTESGSFKKEITIKTREALHNSDAPDFTKEQVEVMKTTIEGAMVYSEPYLRQKFSLPDLSELTNISVHQLSAFINWYYNMNYSDFVNMYRVEHCKRKIMVDEEWQFLTLQAIAEESGFGNRNTFTAAFKKFTSSTPMEFLKQLKVQKLQAAV